MFVNKTYSNELYNGDYEFTDYLLFKQFLICVANHGTILFIENIVIKDKLILVTIRHGVSFDTK